MSIEKEACSPVALSHSSFAPPTTFSSSPPHSYSHQSRDIGYSQSLDSAFIPNGPSVPYSFVPSPNASTFLTASTSSADDSSFLSSSAGSRATSSLLSTSTGSTGSRFSTVTSSTLFSTPSSGDSESLFSSTASSKFGPSDTRSVMTTRSAAQGQTFSEADILALTTHLREEYASKEELNKELSGGKDNYFDNVGNKEWDEFSFGGSPIRSSPVRSRAKDKVDNDRTTSPFPLSVDDFLLVPEDISSDNSGVTNMTSVMSKAPRRVSQLAFSNQSTGSTSDSTPFFDINSSHSFQQQSNQQSRTFISPHLLSNTFTLPTLPPPSSDPNSNSPSQTPIDPHSHFQPQSQVMPEIPMTFPHGLEFPRAETPTHPIDLINPDDDFVDITPTRTRNSTLTGRTPRSSARRKPPDTTSPGMSLGALQLGEEHVASTSETILRSGHQRRKLARTTSTPALTNEGSTRATRQKIRAASPIQLRTSPRHQSHSHMNHHAISQSVHSRQRLSKLQEEEERIAKKRKRSHEDTWTAPTPLLPPPPPSVAPPLSHNHSGPEFRVSPPLSTSSSQGNHSTSEIEKFNSHLQSPFSYHNGHSQEFAGHADERLFFAQTLPQFQPIESTGSPDLAEVFESLVIITQFLAENADTLNQNNVPFATPEAITSLKSLKQKAWLEMQVLQAPESFQPQPCLT